jgi:hypothetical protein
MRYLILLLFLPLLLQAQSQSGSLSNGFVPNVIPPSPTAASLGKFGQWPVGYYTGVPNISMPIYTIKSRQLSLPVTLSYHASGIKVEEMAGWTGTGWALDAGGVITRSIVGGDDKDPNGFYNRMLQGKFLKTSYNLHDKDDYLFLKQAASGDIDTEPDQFYFNFAGHSGKFFFDENGGFHSIPVNALKLVNDPLRGNGVNNYWELLDEQGITYQFYAVEQTKTASSSGTAGDYHDNAWYLTRMISSDKSDTITIDYAAKSESYNLKAIQELRELTSTSGTTYYSNDWESMFHTRQVLYNGQQTESNLTRLVTNGNSRLSAIHWSDGDMTFTALTSRQDMVGPISNMLDSIAIFAKDGSLASKYALNYSYVNGRYYLDSLSQLNSGLTDKLTNRFYYYTGLPSRFSNSQDHWGYYNGAPNNNLLPNDADFTTITNSNRDANETMMKAGTLYRIVYPTGGHTDFDYEAHRYTAVSSSGGTQVISSTNILWLGVYDPTTPNYYDSSGVINVATSQSDASLEIIFRHYNRPNANNVGWKPYVQLEKWVSQNNAYSVVNSWNAYDLFPGGSIPLNADGSVNFTVHTTVSLLPGQYRLSVGNQCLSRLGDCSADPQKAGITADLTYKSTITVNNNQTPPASMAGGLRIKSIKSYDNLHNTPVTFKQFSYSGGQLLTNPVYKHYYSLPVSNSGVGQDQGGDHVDCGFNIANFRALSSTSQAILGLTQGAAVSYQYVTESDLDTAGVNNGYTAYTYSFPPDSLNSFNCDLSYWPTINGLNDQLTIPVNSYDYIRGLLLQTDTYKRQDTSYYLIKRVKDTYATNVGDTAHLSRRLKGLHVRAMRIIDNYPCGFTYNGYIFPTDSSFTRDFGYGYYALITSWIQKSSTEETNYYDTSLVNKLVNTTNYYYDNNQHLQVTRTSSVDSKGDTYLLTNKYPHEMVAAGVTTPYATMVTRNMINKVVSQQVVKNSTTLISNQQINFNAFTSNLIAPNTLQTATLNYPLENNTVLEQYDAYGNVIQYSQRDGVEHALIYDYRNMHVIAHVVNALVTNTAYTGFEADGKGGWSFTGLPSSTSAFTGKKAYQLSGGTITKTGIDVSKSYIVSYWSAGGSALVNSQSGTSGLTINGWTLYQHQLSGTSSITVSGSVSIDELRLYPSDAQMTTYTYAPLIGVTAEITPDNKVSYYEYDGFNRLLRVRDQYKNILKQNQYVYMAPRTDTTARVYFNEVKSQTYTKACTSGGIPDTITYTVPADRYSSTFSLADANSQATADITTNGQTYANTVGFCNFGNVAKSQAFTRASCDSGGTPLSINYSVAAGKYTSVISQAAADAQAQAEIDSNGQTYANTYASCRYFNDVQSQAFTKSCTGATHGTSVIYTVNAYTDSSDISKTDANNKAKTRIAANGQNYANTNGSCLYWSDAMSQVFTKACSLGYVGSQVTYALDSGAYKSPVSKAAADSAAQNDINTYGQGNADQNGSCSADPSHNLFVGQGSGTVAKFTVKVATTSGTTVFEQEFKGVGDPALPYYTLISNGTYNVTVTVQQSTVITVNGSQRTVTTPQTWSMQTTPIIISASN